MDCNPPGSSLLDISHQEYWSELPFVSPEGLPHPWIKPVAPALAGRLFITEPQYYCEAYDESMLKLLKNCQNVFQSVCTILYSLQQCVKVPIFPHHRQQLSSLFSSVQFSCSVMSDSFQPHEPQHTRPLCPSATPGVHP